MAALTRAVLSVSGTVVTMSAATVTVGDTCDASDGKTICRITNASGSGITVTATAATSCSQGFTHDLSGSVANGVTKEFPIPAYLASLSTGKVTVICSAVSSVTIGFYTVG